MKINRKSIVVAILLLGFLFPAFALARVKARVTVRVGSFVPRRTVYYHVRQVRQIRVAPVRSGTIDFNVKPQSSKIFVDGNYLGIVDQFNGYPQTAILPTGYHNIRIVSPSGQVVRQRVYVAAGREFNLNLKF